MMQTQTKLVDYLSKIIEFKIIIDRQVDNIIKVTHVLKYLNS